MITWHNAATNPPERLRDVLLAVRGKPESAEGFRAPAGDYIYSTGHAVPIGAVYAWAPLPACPAVTLKPLRKCSVKEGRR